MTIRRARAPEESGVTVRDRLVRAGLDEKYADLFLNMPHKVVHAEPRRPFREPGVPRDEVIDLDRFRSLAAAGDLERLRAEWSRHPLMQTHAPAARELMREILADYDARDLAAPGEAPGLPHETLRLLPMPVLSMTGSHDTPWRRACAQALAEVAPRARALEIPAAGHLANADNPDVFNAEVARFLHSCTSLQPRPAS